MQKTFIGYVLVGPVFGCAIAVLVFLKILIIFRLLVSWVSVETIKTRMPLWLGKSINMLYTLTEPVVSYFRKTVPLKLGLFDMSPLVTLVAVEIALRLCLFILSKFPR